MKFIITGKPGMTEDIASRLMEKTKGSVATRLVLTDTTRRFCRQLDPDMPETELIGHKDSWFYEKKDLRASTIIIASGAAEIQDILEVVTDEAVTVITYAYGMDDNGGYDRRTSILVEEIEKLPHGTENENYAGMLITGNMENEDPLEAIEQVTTSARSVLFQHDNLMKVISHAKAMGIVNAKSADTVTFWYEKNGTPYPKEILTDIAASIILKDDTGLASLMREWLSAPVEINMPEGFIVEQDDDDAAEDGNEEDPAT